MSPLSLPADLLAELGREAEASYPKECCGGLMGRGSCVAGPESSRGGSGQAAVEEGDGETIRVARIAPCENAAADPARRYSIAPEELLALHRAAREEGLDVVGYYHSHPSGGAEPSEVDRAESWPGLAYVIIPVDANGAGPVRCWRFTDDGPAEEPILMPSSGESPPPHDESR